MLSHNPEYTKVLSIDLENLNPEQSTILASALANIKKRILYNIEQKFSITKIITFNNTNIILNHKITFHHQHESFIIVNNKMLLGNDSQGSVFESLGELIIDNKKLTLQLTNQYAIKIIPYRHDTVALLNTEYEASKKLAYLGLQKPLMGDQFAILIMNRIPGENLFVELKKGEIQLTKENLIDLSLRILYQAQLIHIYESLHLDIKPKNIMINKKQGYYSARLIDFGISVPIGTTLNIGRGSPGFAAPEVFLSFTFTKEADAYSTGVTLAALFKAPPNQINLIARNNRKFDLHLLDELDFPPVVKKIINQTIHELTRAEIDPEKSITPRKSIEEAIFNFQHARVLLKKSCVDKAQHDTIDKAFHISLEARNKLRKINCTPTEMQIIIKEALYALDDNPDSLKEFCDVTNIKLFKNATSKKECLLILNETTTKYLAYAAINPKDALVMKIENRAKLDNMNKLLINNYGLFSTTKNQVATKLIPAFSIFLKK